VPTPTDGTHTDHAQTREDHWMTGRALRRLPLFSTAMSLAILLIHSVSRVLYPSLAEWLICRPSRVLQGEVWRLLTTVGPHNSAIHLVNDVVYLVVVGILAESFLGVRKAALTWCGCAIAGSGLFVLFSNPLAAVAGSSDATHGLAACVSGYLALSARHAAKLRYLSLAFAAYLLYKSVYAIFTGHTPALFDPRPNPGWDHLGGVLMGLLAGTWFGFRATHTNDCCARQ